MQEELQTAMISVSVTSIENIIEILSKICNDKNFSKNNLKHGTQSIKNLNKHNSQLETIEMPSDSLKAMKKELKKKGVDSALVQNKDDGTLKIYFKGKDIEQIKSVLEDYSKGNLEQKTILEKVQAIKQELDKQLKQEKIKNKTQER